MPWVRQRKRPSMRPRNARGGTRRTDKRPLRVESHLVAFSCTAFCGLDAACIVSSCSTFVKVVHPASSFCSRRIVKRQLPPGGPAAHEPDRLPLLPSGPDGVRRRSVAQDLAINAAFFTTQTENRKPQTWEFDPAIADCGYRAPLPPRLARPKESSQKSDFRCQTPKASAF